jgi:hypothetical protein
MMAYCVFHVYHGQTPFHSKSRFFRGVGFGDVLAGAVEGVFMKIVSSNIFLIE